MRKKLCAGILLLSTTLLFGACGGGGGSDADLNYLFSGDYQANFLEGIGSTGSIELIADGAGNVSSPAFTTSLTYNISSDRTMSLGTAVPGETSYGIINVDGSLLALTLTAPAGTGVQLAVAVAKSSAITTADLPGEYILGQAGFNSGEFYTSQVLVTINAGGVAGSWEILAHSDGIPGVPRGSLDIALTTPGDGTFVVNNGSEDH